MTFIKMLLVLTISLSSLFAKNYFVGSGDICEAAVDHYCTNDPETIKNLQIALSSDRRLNLKGFIPDGIWGNDTKKAIIAFQTKYRLEPADSWVGKSTKEMLDKVYAVKPYSFSEGGDMCMDIEGQECPNDFEDVRNLQILLNMDKNLSVELSVDGIWGKKTTDAVIAFQKQHGMVQVDGWVGKGTKRFLDTMSTGMLFPIAPKKYKEVKRSTVGRVVRGVSGSHEGFVHSRGYPRTFKVYKNNKLLKKANGRNTKIVIDISQQRIRLLVSSVVAIDSPATTGQKRHFEPNTKKYYNKSTPKGNFKITEKIADKRSTIFGKLYRNGKLVWRGDRRKYHGPPAKYIGASLKHWMRLTSSGIGIHGSKYIKRYPGTNGCIRVPYNIVSKIFSKVRKGTPVRIVQ